MKYVLDTCALIWAVAGSDELSVSARKALEDENSNFLVSPISCAEIACLVERKKIQLNQHWKTWFRKYVNQNQWELVPIDLPLIEEAYSLPGEFHRDPADRLLVATARLHRATMLTADQRILDYPHVETIW